MSTPPRHLWLALAAVTCFALKRFNQQAGVDELHWILAPTSWLTGGWTGHDFVYEPGFGYVSFGERFVIAPECSGINFLVILFASLTGSAWLSSRLDGLRFSLAALGSLLMTVLVNSVRITLSLTHPVVLGLDAADSHRALGIVVFCASLFVTHLVWTRCALHYVRPPLWVAMAAYLSVTLVVPVLRASTGPEFMEHAVWTLGLSIALLLVAFGGWSLRGRPTHLSFGSPFAMPRATSKSSLRDLRKT